MTNQDIKRMKSAKEQNIIFNPEEERQKELTSSFLNGGKRNVSRPPSSDSSSTSSDTSYVAQPLVSPRDTRILKDLTRTITSKQSKTNKFLCIPSTSFSTVSSQREETSPAFQKKRGAYEKLRSDYELYEISSYGMLDQNRKDISESNQLLSTVKRGEFESTFIKKVIEFLYIGSIEAAYCEPILCRLNIKRVVDISGLHPNQVPREKKTHCPCTCPLETAHHRQRLFISVVNSEEEDVRPYFTEFNKFIQAGIAQKQNILVHDVNCASRGPTFVIQYLIQIKKMCYKSAFDLVLQCCPDLSIFPPFSEVLLNLDRYRCRRSPSPSFYTERFPELRDNAGSEFQSKRADAWC
ncbi:uncharacterized protein LOC136024731 isoform X2 [Artemia franciscana]